MINNVELAELRLLNRPPLTGGSGGDELTVEPLGRVTSYVSVFVKTSIFMFGVGRGEAPAVGLFLCDMERPCVCRTVKFCMPHDVLSRILSYFNECGSGWHPEGSVCEFVRVCQRSVPLWELSERWFAHADTHAVWSLVSSMTGGDFYSPPGVRCQPKLNGAGVCSQLSGPNGSWTGKDDVPAGSQTSTSESQADRKRRGKEAKTHTLHSSNVGALGKHTKVPSQVGSLPSLPSSEAGNPPQVIDPVLLVTGKVGPAGYPRFASFNHRFVILSAEGLWEDVESGLVYFDTVGEGTFVDGYVYEAGTMRPNSEVAGTVARFPFEYVEGDEERPGSWIYTPGFRYLQENFAACVVTESVIRAYVDRLHTKFPFMDMEVKHNTAECYALRFKGVNARIISLAGAPALVRRTLPMELDARRRVLAGLQPFSVLNLGLQIRNYIESDIFPSKDVTERRNAFEVIKMSNARLVDGMLVYNTARFKLPKTYLVAVDIRGDREFDRAAATPRNQAAALTRVFKCRGGTREFDELYEAKQLTMLNDLVGRWHPFVLRDARMKVSLAGFELLCEGKKKRLPFVRDSVYDNMHARVLNRCQTVVEIYSPIGTLWYIYRKWVQIYGSVTVLLRGTTYAAGIIWLMFWHIASLRYFYSDIPHAKRALRQRLGMNMEMMRGDFVVEVKAEVKDEPVKPGKPPRVYFNLGPEASLYGGHIMEVAKKAFVGERVIVCRGFVAYMNFVDAGKPQDMAKVFALMHRRIHSREKCVCINVYSDDMALGSNMNGEMYWEVDISSCDSSVGVGLFNLAADQMLKLGIPVEQVEGLLSQCSKPFRIRNPLAMKEFMFARFYGYYLMSGTVLTTYLDTWSSLLIGGAIIAAFEAEAFEADAVRSHIATLGFVVTIEARSCFEAMTFLKRHPCRNVYGEWEAPMCVGAWLRSFGKIVPELGDTVVPGSKGWALEKRAKVFLGSLLEGWKNEPVQPLLTAMREAFPFMGHTIVHEQAHRQLKHSGAAPLDVSGVCARYGISFAEYQALSDTVGTLVLGDILVSDAVAKIYSVDYGL